MNFDVNKIRRDFPILYQKVRGKKLIYLDNAATTQRPRAVIEATNNFYRDFNSNVHRGIYFLSQKATEVFDKARQKVKNFINAQSEKEIIFVKGATEAINLAAVCFGKKFLKKGDEVLISEMEHHSNIVPWQIVCQERGAKLKVIPVTDGGDIKIEELERLLTKKTKIVAITHISNVLGTVNPIKTIIKLAHRKKIPVLVDGAQSAARLKIDVQNLDCDFYAFSGHKMYGPTGIGVLYGKEDLLELLPPYQAGGEMIRTVSFAKTTYSELPSRFEAGTPNIAGVIGLGRAIDYINQIGRKEIERHEKDLSEYCVNKIGSIPGIKILGQPQERTGAVSFIFEQEKIHPHDVGTFLDQEGIAIRTGHHCAQPLMARFGVSSTSRASFGIYNTKEEIDKLKIALEKVKDFFLK